MQTGEQITKIKTFDSGHVPKPHRSPTGRIWFEIFDDRHHSEWKGWGREGGYTVFVG